jgi:hypothetical protein
MFLRVTIVGIIIQSVGPRHADMPSFGLQRDETMLALYKTWDRACCLLYLLDIPLDLGDQTQARIRSDYLLLGDLLV